MKVSVVIPAYNEAGNIKLIADQIARQLIGTDSYELIFVDDGSADSTLTEIKRLAANNNSVKFISFSRNFGHQRALKAGLDHASGDCVISMDADLQHPPELINKLIAKWKEGYDVVYTVRKDLKNTRLFKRTTSMFFYKLINRISDVDIPLGAADFRLLDKKVVDELRGFKENSLFIRGLVSWLGYKQTGIEYITNDRHSGSTKYTLMKMIAFAVHGITSFSIIPLRISILVGFIVSMFAFLYTTYALLTKFYFKTAIAGWTSILISVLFLGGIQLIFLGVIGEYLGKMFVESKNRPHYVIKEKNL
ncbi:glycosyltransferase [candidate division WS5 bacterium]|uniref:Glycosyltransferase n=1 Tax=candidate division WS5 bacterium TaxID=2093353 RepID=A0A419DD81_9BACT|nr:MAG: glycosyltransferase [candidate division WS5 bacterium]